MASSGGAVSQFFGSKWAAVVVVAAAATGAIVIPTVTGSSGFTCNTTISSGASLSSAMSSATAGTTVCLNAGTYTYTDSTISKASMTYARAANGVTRSQVVLSGIDVQSSNNLSFRSMTLDGAGIGTSTTTATNIQFTDMVFTDGVCVNLPGTNSSRGILIDSSDFPDVTEAGCGNEGRLQFNGRNTGHSSGYSQGVTVQNSYFHGPNDGGANCSDMIQLNGDAAGVSILNNEFASLKEDSCGVIHGDPIQFYGGNYTTIDGNYIHDSSSGLMNGDCNGTPLTLTNNVIVDGGEITANTVRMSGSGGNILRHNTIVGAPITYGTPNCATSATGETITNNAFGTSGDGIDTQNSATVSGTIDYNLSTQSTARGTHGVNGTPTYTGGSTPTTWAGYVLTAPTAALTGASDGTKMGIN